MGIKSIVEHIPNLDREARQLAERMKHQPKNRYGIPLYRLQPIERRGVEKTDTFCRKANMHMMQLIHEAEAAHQRGHLAEFPEVDDPWEQDTLQRLLKGMNSKGTSVTRYPWNPVDVLYVDDLILALKNIIADGPILNDAPDEAGEAQQPLTDSQRIQHLEDTMQQVVDTLRNNNIIL